METRKINYHNIFKQQLEKIDKMDKKPTLLLHVCCAPCSSGCLEMLTNHFSVKVLFYNPNISPKSEFLKRDAELKKFVKENESLKNVEIIECDYESEKFKQISCGLEKEQEGGRRCERCFRLRLDKTAQICKKLNFDFFTTTLTISPLKNSQILNQIGLDVAKEYNVNFLASDFKKEDGYKKSIENSKKYNLYRQDYCGCIYSKLERENFKKLEKITEQM